MILLAGCQSALVVVSDLHGDRWELVDPWSGRVKHVHDVDGTNVDDCRVQDGVQRFCLVYQSRHRVTSAGTDEVAYTYTPVGEDEEGQDGLRGRIVGIEVGAADTEAWRLDRLDWSAFDPDRQLCNWDPADPCLPAPGATDDEVHACTLYWPHDFRVLGDDPLTLAIADTRNDRVVYATHPGAGTCAVVTDVLGPGHADWDSYASINALDAWEDGEGRQLLLSSKDTLGGTLEGSQDGAEARGKILRFTDDGTGWRQRWEFPPDEAGHVNAPHGLARTDSRIYAGQALGAGDTWEEGTGGSVLVLDTDGNYLYDAVPARGDLLYTRSVSFLPDGSLLVVDSGTKGEEAQDAAATSLFVLDPGDAPASGLGGTWSADHADQEFVPLRVLKNVVPDDAFVLYSGDPVLSLGSGLGG